MLAGLCMHETEPDSGITPLPAISCTLVLIRQESIDFIDGVHLSMHGCLCPRHYPVTICVGRNESRPLLQKHHTSVSTRNGIGRSQAPCVCGKVLLTFLVSFVRLLPVAMTLPSLTMTHLCNAQIFSHSAENIVCMHLSA